MPVQALIVVLFIVAVVIEAAILYQVPWQVVGTEFVRALAQLFVSAPQAVESALPAESKTTSK